MPETSSPTGPPADPTNQDDGATSDPVTTDPATAYSTSEKPLNIGQFDVKDPNAWFFKAEMIFRIRNIRSESRKAELIMESLPPPCWNVVGKFFDETASPTYAQVKEELLEHWDTPPASRAKQFFDYFNSTAGDTNISTMYHTLETLTTIPKSTTREKTALNLVMEMTLQLYPTQVRAQLPDYTGMDVKAFLRQADRILSAYTPPKSLAAATIEEEEETEEVAAPLRRERRHFTKQSHFQQKKKKPDVCFYHSRFGKDAFRCQSPCKFSKND